MTATLDYCILDCTSLFVLTEFVAVYDEHVMSGYWSVGISIFIDRTTLEPIDTLCLIRLCLPDPWNCPQEVRISLYHLLREQYLWKRSIVVLITYTHIVFNGNKHVELVNVYTLHLNNISVFCYDMIS